MRAFLERLRPLAPISLRLVVGALAIVYGAERVHPSRFAPFVDVVLAWNLPRWMAYALVWGSLGGGALLVIGFLSRLAAVVVAAATVLVFIKLKLWSGPFHGGWDVPLIEFAACVSVLLSGAGRMSVDDKLFNR